MRERWIKGGILLGLLCFVVALYATLYRHGTGSCGGVSDGCDVPVSDPHPYAHIGVLFMLLGLVAFGFAVRLALNQTIARSDSN
jgi:hypothetical protein